MSPLLDPAPTVILGPDAVTEPRTAHEVLDKAFAARGLTGEVLSTASAREFDAEIRSAARGSVVVPGTAPLAEIIGARFLRVDLGARERLDAPGVRLHIRGRGLEGLRDAVDA